MTVAANILAYREFLKQRDGVADIYRPSLSRREEFFARLDEREVRSKHEFDRDVFLKNVTGERDESGLCERMRWLIWTARSNQAERFGVELSRLYGHGGAESDLPEDMHPQLQEFYHTRVLVDVVAMFSLPVPACPPP